MERILFLAVIITLITGMSSDGRGDANGRRSYPMRRHYWGYVDDDQRIQRTLLEALRIPVLQQPLPMQVRYRIPRPLVITPRMCWEVLPQLFLHYRYGETDDSKEDNKCEDWKCEDNDKCAPTNCVGVQCDRGYCGQNCEPSPVKTGKSCTSDPDCLTDGALCIDGVCRCDCNETFSGEFTISLLREFFPVTERSKCLKDCPDGLSPTFTNGTKGFSLDVEKLVEREMTLEECQKLCLDETEFICRSVSLIITEGGGCGLSRTRQSETPINIIKDMDSGFQYSERKCK